MSLVGDDGEEEDLCHVRSGGYSDMYLVGDGEGEANLSNVHNGGY